MWDGPSVSSEIEHKDRFTRTIGMATDKSITVTEWLDRFMDLEAHLARGGSLLDLPIDALDSVPPDMVRSLVKQMGRERLNQIGRVRDGESGATDHARTDQALSEQPAGTVQDDKAQELH